MVIISVRVPSSEVSHFVNTALLLEGEDPDKILELYEKILYSVQAYEQSKMALLIDLNERIFRRLEELHQQEQVSLCATIMTLGLNRLQRRYRRARIFELHNELAFAVRKIQESLKPRKPPKQPLPPTSLIARYFRERLQDPVAELARLKKTKRIADALSKEAVRALEMEPPKLLAFAHSIELLVKLRKTHYVINHSQSNDLIILNIVAKKLKERFAGQKFAYFEVLRHDVHLRLKHNVTWFRRELLHAQDDAYRGSLICGDLLLENNARHESALYFFSREDNIASGENFFGKYDFLKAVLQPMIAAYFCNLAAAKQLFSELIKLADTLGEGATLYSICIEKERFEQVAYCSGEYGYPLNPCSAKELAALQRGVEREGEVPQVRVLAHMLDPERDYVIAHSSAPQEKIERVEQQVEQLILHAELNFRLRKNRPFVHAME